MVGIDFGVCGKDPTDDIVYFPRLVNCYFYGCTALDALTLMVFSGNGTNKSCSSTTMPIVSSSGHAACVSSVGLELGDDDGEADGLVEGI